MVCTPHRWLARIVLVIVMVVGTLGCAPERGTGRVVDLVEALPSARVLTETDTMLFGDQEAREFLGTGWFFIADESTDFDQAWGTGRRSEVVFFRLQQGDLTLSINGRSVNVGEGRVQRVSFFVNRQPVGEWELGTEPQSIRIDLPAEAVRFGENHLVMEYAHSLSREQAYPKQGKDRAALWHSLEISPTEGRNATQPTADPSARRVFIPFGSRVDFLLGELPDGEFSAERVDVVGAERGRLVVLSQSGDGEESVAGVLVGDRSSSPLTITTGGSDRVRLSLAAVGPRFMECTGPCGIVITGPTATSRPIESPATVDSAAADPSEPAKSRRPNVIVYLIDALRADHLGCYGYARPVSPRIDAFAERAVLFERAQAQTSWTRASVASIFTGLMAQVHAANDDDDALSGEVVTIAEYLKTVGYETAGFCSNGNAGPALGFGQGFDVYRHLGPVRSEECNDAAFAWLEKRDQEKPFFLWVHTVDPHVPYSPPDDLRTRFAPNVEDLEFGSVRRVADLTRWPEKITPQLIEDLVAVYDAEIAANDRNFGILIDELKERGLFEDSLIMVVADHGEEFYDHGGWTHGKTLFAEQLDVPLIVKYPQQSEGERIREIVQHVDMLPTILTEVGLAPSRGHQGRSLQVLMDQTGRNAWDNRSFSFLDLRGRTGSAVIDDRWKVIRFHDRETGHLAHLYDKDADQKEGTDLLAARPEIAATMLALDRQLDLSLPESFEAPTVDISKKKKMWADLKALGYVQ